MGKDHNWDDLSNCYDGEQRLNQIKWFFFLRSNWSPYFNMGTLTQIVWFSFPDFFIAFIFIISSFQVKHIEHSSRKPCTISGLSFIPFQANLHIKWALKPPKHHWIWNHEMKKEGKSNKFERKQNVWRCDCRSQRLQTSFGHQIAGINSRCHHPPQYLDSDVALINI